MKFIGICVLALGLFAGIAKAQNSDIYVNPEAFKIDSTPRFASTPKFPIMPKRKPTPKKKAEVKKPAIVEAIKIPEKKTIIVEEVYPVDEQNLLQKEFENMEVVEPVPTPAPVVSESIFEQPKAEVIETKAQPTPSTETTAIVEPITTPSPAEAEPVITAPISNIVFEGELAPLSEINKQKLDKIIAGFTDAKNNKISIITYNIDDGVDVFKKKRQSLNRAIDVRSYLLDKGYKNFSIRVVNVKDEPEKNNLVEITEI